MSEQWSLGPERFGASVLVALARARRSGRLQWQSGSDTLQLDFASGRPVAAVATRVVRERTAVVTALRRYALLNRGSFTLDTTVAVEQTLTPPIDTLGEVLLTVSLSAPPALLQEVRRAHGEQPIAAGDHFAKLLAAARRVGAADAAPPDGGELFESWLDPTNVAEARTKLALWILGGVQETSARAAEGETHGAAVQAQQPQAAAPSEVGARAQSAQPEASGSASHAGGAAGASPGPDAGRLERRSPLPANAQLRAQVQELDRLYANLDGMSYYELLGVGEDAPADDVRKRYFELAKRWHRDVLASAGLADDVLAMAEAVFGEMGEAQRVLADPQERRNYDFMLERRRQGLPTDGNVIMEAESTFQRAKIMVRRGQAQAAEPLLQRAVELNKGEPEFWVYLGYARYCAQGSDKADEARRAIAHGLSLQSELPEAYVFLGRIERSEERLKRAIKHFEQALELRPNNPDAEFELRLLRRRLSKSAAQKDTGEGQGLQGWLQRLFKR